MNLSKMRDAVTSKAGRQILQVQKHSPKILFVAGAVGFVGTVVLAARATLKVEEVLDEHEKLKSTIDAAQQSSTPSYTDEDARKDTVLLYLKTATKLGKLYAPTFICGAVSIAALTGSHIILDRRYVAMTAAYAAVEKGFSQYRERIVKEFGEDKDRELLQDVEYTTVSEKTAEGKSKKTEVATGANNLSQYQIIFDESNKNWQRPEGYNQLFLRAQQNYANDLLNTRGHVTLNDVFDMLGVERTKMGMIVGWVKGSGGDDFVDFGVFRNDQYRGMEFVKGNERSVILTFNVDGNIYDKI